MFFIWPRSLLGSGWWSQASPLPPALLIACKPVVCVLRRHYIDVERREDGFDRSGPLNPLGEFTSTRGVSQCLGVLCMCMNLTCKREVLIYMGIKVSQADNFFLYWQIQMSSVGRLKLTSLLLHIIRCQGMHCVSSSPGFSTELVQQLMASGGG